MVKYKTQQYQEQHHHQQDHLEQNYSYLLDQLSCTLDGVKVFQVAKGLFLLSKEQILFKVARLFFYHCRFSNLNNDSRKPKRRFKKLFLFNRQRETKNTIEKNTSYNPVLEGWTLLKLDFSQKNYGKKLIYDQVDTPRVDMCSRIIMTIHSRQKKLSIVFRNSY